MEKQRTIAVIPCHNEERMVAEVAKRAAQHCDGVIVVDDHSTDDTFYKVWRERIAIYRNPMHKGVGCATVYGLKQARVDYPSAVAYVTLDGDGQHNPAEIPLVAHLVVEDKADIVCGTRVHRGTMPLYRVFGNWVIALACNIKSGYGLEDVTCCYRAFSGEAVDRLDIKERGYGFATEVVIKARKYNLRVAEVPVACIYHSGLRYNSSMSPLKQALIILGSTIKWRLRA